MGYRLAPWPLTLDDLEATYFKIITIILKYFDNGAWNIYNVQHWADTRSIERISCLLGGFTTNIATKRECLRDETRYGQAEKSFSSAKGSPTCSQNLITFGSSLANTNCMHGAWRGRSYCNCLALVSCLVISTIILTSEARLLCFHARLWRSYGPSLHLLSFFAVYNF